ncbi:tetratricopeptide repeat protein [Bacillus sp. 31A1R]|uniref:Tetratricopeptide repeat protein n=1 Tax=Robertmurraya mangrovi TaxID=3098077 RepID=A0ABU5J1H2_9BACI|nr:tetratricopeptide repeat protein [Bacillus sp. 31A1R]MDZ5473249.1 tetratricopeptide repeat protein [Bacillus sp. 31A1R]
MEFVDKIITQLENGQHEEALKGYNIVLNEGTNEERFTLGEELLHIGFIAEAKALFEKLLLAYPEEGELLVLFAEACMELGEEEEAILALDKINENDPSYPQGLLLLADLYQMDGLYEVSEQKLLKAKAALPDEVIIDFALGELYLEEGKFLEAIRSYHAVLPKETVIAGVNVHQRLGEALSAGGSFEEAIPHYEKALEEKLEINTLFNYAFTALQAGYNKTAIEKFNELKALDPEYHSLYLYLAKAYEQEEEIDQSFETIKAGINLDEYNKELYFYGGKLALKLGVEEEAERLLREALALDPEFLEAALTLNKVLIHQEKYEEVLEICELIQSNGLEEPQLIWDEAHALWHLEQYSQALNKYEAAYNYFKNHSEFLSDYGYFLIEEGKRDAAVEIFTRLQQMDPANVEFEEVLQRLTDDFNHE